MFDCVLADRGSVGDDDDRTQNSKEKVVCCQWWSVYHGCQDQKDQKIEKKWRKRKYICSEFFLKILSVAIIFIYSPLFFAKNNINSFSLMRNNHFCSYLYKEIHNLSVFRGAWVHFFKIWFVSSLINNACITF